MERVWGALAAGGWRLGADTTARRSESLRTSVMAAGGRVFGRLKVKPMVKDIPGVRGVKW